ncbi:hypothetical protein ACES2J_08235 [Bdellovibrio bacteriovorus]|uniref:hypothetical protein n=1 Tax=Bdellovibrio bacteriovorus TaxID=959 RepID=UPI0035A5BC64
MRLLSAIVVILMAVSASAKSEVCKDKAAATASWYKECEARLNTYKIVDNATFKGDPCLCGEEKIFTDITKLASNKKCEISNDAIAAVFDNVRFKATCLIKANP